MNRAERIAALVAEIDECSEILAKDGLMSYGIKGQPVAHPLLAQRRSSMALLYKLESQLPDDGGPSALDEFLGE